MDELFISSQFYCRDAEKLKILLKGDKCEYFSENPMMIFNAVKNKNIAFVKNFSVYFDINFKNEFGDNVIIYCLKLGKKYLKIFSRLLSHCDEEFKNRNREEILYYLNSFSFTFSEKHEIKSVYGCMTGQSCDLENICKKLIINLLVI